MMARTTLAFVAATWSGWMFRHYWDWFRGNYSRSYYDLRAAAPTETKGEAE